MELVKSSLNKWINAAIILTIGILVIISGALIGQGDIHAGDTLEAISLILGIVLLVVGGLSLLIVICLGISAKKPFLASALPGGVFVALGISLIVNKYADDLLIIMIGVLPYLLLVVGALIVLDGVWGIVRCVKGKGSLFAPIVAIVIGTVAIVLGALCVGEKPVIEQHVQLIVFGVVLCVEACFMVLSTLVKTPDVIIVAKSEKK